VLAGPREKFTENEINHLKKYLESGGSILVLLGEGGEKRFNTNINFFLEEYGIMINRYLKTHNLKLIILINLKIERILIGYNSTKLYRIKPV
jgi:intraflagellar transport protein 52